MSYTAVIEMKGDATQAGDGTVTLATRSEVTQDILVLTALPSTFATLHFTNGILTSVT